MGFVRVSDCNVVRETKAEEKELELSSITSNAYRPLKDEEERDPDNKLFFRASSINEFGNFGRDPENLLKLRSSLRRLERETRLFGRYPDRELRKRPRKGIGSERKSSEERQRGERRRDRSKKVVVGEVKIRELRELGNERRESTRIACGVQSDGLDMEGVRGAGEAANEVGSARDRARVRREVP
ncbi:hypothetical protein RJ641_013607 [Dillenia turbinata]|uniref:Uncharacterized protein n=1 Tax=Dillenia turbinata TaxID=194707 RepID=A0AAN8WGF8_9MAGN